MISRYILQGVGLIALSIWLTSAQPAHASTESELQHQYLQVYLKIHDAMDLEKKGDFRQALRMYSNCYSRLAEMHKENPDWEADLIVKRMNGCQEKVRELKPSAADQTPDSATSTNPPLNGNMGTSPASM